MMLAFLFLVFIGVFGAQIDKHAPHLKKGRSSFASRVRGGKHANGKVKRTLSLSSTEKNVVLELVPNSNLLTEDYEEIEINAHVKKTLRKKKDVPKCWYTGKIVGDENSDVLVSDCEGQGFQGLIRRGNGKTFIAKKSGDEKADDEITVFLNEDEDVPLSTCGNDHDHDHDEHEHEHEERNTVAASEIVTKNSTERAAVSALFSARRLLAASETENVVEIALVSDRAYVQRNGGNPTTLAQRNIDIMNLVQATYQAGDFAKPTSIRLKAQFFFVAADEYTAMPVDGNGEVDNMSLLQKFRTWTLSLPVVYDHVHLLTGYKFQGNQVGLAWVGAVCSAYKVGTSIATNSVTLVANTVAHELGHSLGMAHDGSSENPSCNAGGTLMSPMLACPERGVCPFSSCSIQNKDHYAEAVDCMNSWTEPTCSDNVWNGNEQGIDCGGPICRSCSELVTAEELKPPAPTKVPTSKPTSRPTRTPTLKPTTRAPTTRTPTSSRPTRTPTPKPTTRAPTTRTPTSSRPTRTPTFKPTQKPTRTPTTKPTRAPTRIPTIRPTSAPTTSRPTRAPTTQQPTPLPTFRPTRRPTQTPTTRQPTMKPTRRPTNLPTVRPTRRPTMQPTSR